MKSRYSIFSLARNAMNYHKDWERAWRSPSPKAEYDAVIVGAGGHGLATAYYLAKNHKLTNIAVVEKGWLGGGNTGRNTTIIRSNYLQDSSIAIYELARSLYEDLSRDLNFNVMFSPRGVMMLCQTEHEFRAFKRTAHANRLAGLDCRMITAEEVKKIAPIINDDPNARYPILGAYYQPRGGTGRHDAVAWGYARGADSLGVDIIQNCEVFSIRRDGAKVAGLETSKGFIKTKKVAVVTAGHVSTIVQTAGLRLPIAGAVVHRSDLDAGTVVRVEGDLHAITGWTIEEWCAVDHRTFIHPDDVDAYWVDVDAVDPNTIIDRLARMRRRDGSYAWIRDVGLVTEDSRGHRSLRGFSLDVTELEEANATITRQLRQDPLTGLPNRFALNERINALLESDTNFALMISDLDRFKEVNDTLGHEAGDQLLETIARRLAAAVRPGDMVARLGGDEYAIVVVGRTEQADLQALAARLSSECARSVVLNGVAVAIATSTGIALRSRSGQSRATMLRHADIAMYEAKRGSESFRVFDESLEQTSTLRLTLSASLAAAIENGELTVFFQPKYDMATRRLVGAEALSRWNHPEFGLLTPAAFLDIALMSESAVPFAISTIRRAAAMAQQLERLGTPMPIAANVAMRALRDPSFAPRVLAALAELGVSPSLLVLELTESDPLWPNTHTVTGLQLLIDAGVQLSIDDFGTGHSSLERLRVLKVHELKVDRSFVDGMLADASQRQIVRTVIDLAHGLGCQVVAEGVETEDQLSLLLGLGCEVAQGYLFARPMPADEFVELARAEAIAGAVPAGPAPGA